MAWKKSYSIIKDVMVQSVDEAALKSELAAGVKSVACVDVGRVGDALNVVFVDNPSNEELGIIDRLVKAHVPPYKFRGLVVPKIDGYPAHPPKGEVWLYCEDGAAKWLAPGGNSGVINK